ncbi:hypothetical protein BLNAU_6696 [Blattamonas nauphoetae]|uniref:Uncharacterized protein n=1 Tax=Blattamonas nauphoetae TaxID=2049346 RepID=A0ABQ9Y3Y6_9EUKA|nr:hypothetical protein BLNAU_6696 [Blattamonas nauphoetae]
MVWFDQNSTMYPNPSVNDVENRPQDLKEGHTLQSVLDELPRCGCDVRTFVHSSTWLNVPAVIRSWKEGDDSALLVQLLEAVDDVLKQTCDADIPIVNKHLLHSSLSSLAQNESLTEDVRIQVTHCLRSLESVVEGPFVLMEREQAQAMERELEELKRQNEEKTSTITEMTTKMEALKEKETQTRLLEEMMRMLREVRDKQLHSLDEEHKEKETQRKRWKARQTLRTGGEAVEYFGPILSRYGPSFSLSMDHKFNSLLSFEIGAVVARFTFVIGKMRSDFYCGIVARIHQATAPTDWFIQMKGGAGWCPSSDARSVVQNNKTSHSGEACMEGAVGQKIVLEADGREGKRTLKLSQDGLTQPTFFTNIPVPFRFAVGMNEQNDSVTIESLAIVDEPQMVGGAIEEGHTLKSVLDELTRRVRDVREFVNSSTWLNVPSVLRSWKEGDDSALLVQLLKGVDDVLKQTCDADIPIVNKHLLHSSLSSLAQNASLAKNVRVRVTHCLRSLESVVEGPFVMLEKEEVQAMVREVEKLTNENTELRRQNEQHINTMNSMRMQIETYKAGEARRKEGLTRQALRIGARAIEYFGRGIARYGDSFSCISSNQSGSLVSFEVGPVVARFTFILATNPSAGFSFGLAAHFQTANAVTGCFPWLKGGAGWFPNYGYKNMLQNSKEYHRGTACLAGVVGQKIVLEAD